MSDFVETQSRQAYVTLERMIVTLRLKPGARVNERALMEACDLGRSPVREAIHKLEWQGLMAIKPRSGLVIAELRPADQIHILETRRQLEPLAARLVAGNMSPPARQALIDCAKQMTECAVTADIEGFLEADKEFDLILEAHCPNPFLSQALAPLQTHSRRFWFAGANAERLDRSVQLHVAVIRAMLREDGDEAESAMVRLIDGLSEMARTG